MSFFFGATPFVAIVDVFLMDPTFVFDPVDSFCSDSLASAVQLFTFLSLSLYLNDVLLVAAAGNR